MDQILKLARNKRQRSPSPEQQAPQPPKVVVATLEEKNEEEENNDLVIKGTNLKKRCRIKFRHMQGMLDRNDPDFQVLVGLLMCQSTLIGSEVYQAVKKDELDMIMQC